MRIIQFFFCCLLISFHLTAEEAGEDFRDWTIITGGQFEAKITGMGATTVTLENREGKSIDFPVSDLRPSDQHYAREWQRTLNRDLGVDSTAGVELSAFGKRVQDNLVELRGKRLQTMARPNGPSPQFYVFYRSASWCPPCRAFTPDLVNFYKTQKHRKSPFELIFISSDRSEKDMIAYMDDYNMPWPAFRHQQQRDIVASHGRGIPNLIVTDANGEKLLDSYDPSGKYRGARTVMRELEALLAKAR